ncbi:RNA helicase [Mycena chlorophos]|uniref:L-dopachrome isomerase n=1 Tax=Mycena chlorophos TaxID=658473 RepID=A0A8H6TUT3_MYCCL|nr:RNA helicase [Mycena chlorophos]
MPFLDLKVNVDVSRAASSRSDPRLFMNSRYVLPCTRLRLTSTVQISAKILNKPESLIAVCITVNKTLTFAGTFKPAFNLVITSLGNLNPQANEKYSAEFTEFLDAKLGIPNDRGYMSVSFLECLYRAHGVPARSMTQVAPT